METWSHLATRMIRHVSAAHATAAGAENLSSRRWPTTTTTTTTNTSGSGVGDVLTSDGAPTITRYWGKGGWVVSAYLGTDPRASARFLQSNSACSKFRRSQSILCVQCAHVHTRTHAHTLSLPARLFLFLRDE